MSDNYSLIIKNGSCYVNRKLTKTDIGLSGNKIKKVGNIELNSSKVYDATNKVVLPGIIDTQVHFREPGSTDASEKIRDILLDSSLTLSSQTELLLMYASRSELVAREIKSSKYDYILLDRYFDASMAYQGFGRNLDKEFINLLKSFINAPDPDLTILLDIDPAKGFERKAGDSMDR